MIGRRAKRERGWTQASRLFAFPLLAILTALIPTVAANAGSIGDLSVTPQDPGAGQYSIYTFQFTVPTADSLPADGIIRITFPTEFDLTTVLVAMGGDSLDGGVTVSTNQDTVYVFRDSTGTTLPSGDRVTLRIANVRNATAVGSYLIQLETLKADSTQISTGSASVQIVPGPLHHFTISGFQDTVTAGVAFTGTITVRAYDAYGNLKTNYDGTVAWSTSDPSAQVELPPNSAFDGTSGTKTFDGSQFKLFTAGPQTFTITDLADSIQATSRAVNVKPGPIASFSVSGPTSVTAGTPFTLNVTNAKDQWGNDANGTVQVTLAGGDAAHAAPDGTLPIRHDITVSQGTGSAQQTLYKAETSVQFTLSAAGASQSWTVDTVSPGALASLRLDGYPQTVTAGDPVPFRVTALDAWDNVKTDYTGTITFGSSDGQAILPSDYPFQSGDNGVHADTVVLKTAGLQRIWVAETDGSPSDTTSAILVQAGPIASFDLSAPDTVTAGEAFALSVQNAQDAYGNPASGTVSVSLSASGTSPNGTEPQLASITVSDGSGAAQQVLVKAGSATLNGQAGTVTDNVSLVVKPGALARFRLQGVPGSVTAGQAFPNPVTVTAYDAYGNQKTDYTGFVYFTSTDGQATLTYSSANPYTFRKNEGGSHAFPGSAFVLKTSGAQTITVTDGAIEQESSAISVSPTSLESFALSAGTTQTAGVGFSLTVSSAVDSFGNPWSGTVQVSVASGGGPSPNGTGPSLSDITVSQGSGSATQVLVNAVPTVLQGTTDGVTVQTNPITVKPGALARFTMTGYPDTVTSGANFGGNDVTVSAYDAYGNLKTDYSGSVWFTSSDPSATLPYKAGNAYPFDPNQDAGTHTFPGTGFALATEGLQTITVTDGTISETSSHILVLSSGISDYDLQLDTLVTAGQAFTITVVNAVDGAGNPASGTVTVSIVGGSGVSPNGTEPALQNISVVDGTGSASQVLVLTGRTTLRTQSGSVTKDTTVTVKPGAFGSLALTGVPSQAIAGQAWTNDVTVTAYDRYGNRKTDYTGSVYFFCNTDPGAQLPATSASPYSFVTADNGQRAFSGSGFTLNTPGTHHIGVHDVDTGYEALSGAIDVTGLELLSVTAGVSEVTRGQTGVDVTMTIRKRGGQAVTDLGGALSFRLGSTDVSGEYAVARTDTHTVIPAAQEGTLVLTFRVDVGAAASLGSVVISGSVSGKVNGVTVGDSSPSSTSSWTVYKPASLTVTGISIAQDTVYQGDTGVAAEIYVVNGDAQTATAIIDAVDLLFRGAGGDQTSDFTRHADSQNPTSIAGGQVDTFRLTFDVSQIARTGGVDVYGWVRGHDANSGAVTADTSSQGQAASLVVAENPALRIVSISTSQSKVTSGQDKPWQIRVAIENGTATPLTIDFSGQNTYVRLRKGGGNLTGEYRISGPTQLAGGGTSLAPGAVDTLVFTVEKTGSTTGEVSIFARVAAGGGIYTDSELSGVYGSVTVQAPPSLSIQSVTPSQPTVTAGQERDWTIRVVVRNSGEADFRLDPDSTWVSFSTGSDFSVEKPAAWTGSGDLLLRGGATDTLVFTVQQTGATAGECTISARVKGVDVNSDVYYLAPTATGSVSIQTPADLHIVSIVASDTFLTRDTSTNWTVRVTVENRGESAATVDLSSLDSTYIAVYRVSDGSRQTDYSIALPVGFESSGSAILPGGASDVLEFTVARTGHTIGTMEIRAALRATEDNSGRRIRVTSPDGVVDRVVVQTPSSVIYLPGSLQPLDVNRGSNARFSLRVYNSGGSTVRLDPGATVFRFSDGIHAFEAFLDSTQVRAIASGDTTLTFVPEPVPANMVVGAYAPEVTLVGDENGNPYTKTLTLADSVRVHEAATLAIEATLTSQLTVTAGQTRSWTVSLVITNNGGSPVALDSTKLHFYRLSTDVSDYFAYLAPTVFAGSGTNQLAGGQTDSLVFQVTSVDSAAPTGSIRIQGEVHVTDVNDPGRHLSQSTDGNSGYVIVQSPAVLDLVSVRPWQSSVTRGQDEDWYVTVKVRNTGESAVTIDSSATGTHLRFGFGTGWQVLQPTGLSDGTWVLNGGETDSLVFTVDVSDSSASGICTIDAAVRAVENNSGRTLADSSDASTRGSVLLQTPAQVRIDTLLVDTASAPRAPYLDADQPFTLKVKVTNVGEEEADSVVVSLRSAQGLSSIPTSVNVGSVPGGASVWGQVQARVGSVGDTTETIHARITKAVARNTGGPAQVLWSESPLDTTYSLLIQKPAYLAIDSVWTDRDTVIAKQTVPYWHVYVSVTDTGSAPVLVANPSATNLQFRIRGVTQSGYVVAPVPLSEQERTLDPAAGKSSVVLTYEIRQTGATGGLAGIFATVRGTDLNYPTREPAPTASGSGQVYVAALAAVQIVRTEPIALRLDGEGRALVNVGQSFSIEVDVANRGGEDLQNVTIRVVSDGASSVESEKTISLLRVGETVTLSFGVTAAGVEDLDGEVFRAQVVSARGRDSGLDAEIVPASDDVAVAVIQSPARLRLRWVRNAAPNAPFVDTGQTFPVQVKVENLGTETAQSVELGLRARPDSALVDSLYTVALPQPLAGHDSVTAIFNVTTSQLTDTVSLKAEIRNAIGANTGAPAQVDPALSDSTIAIVQKPAAPLVLAVDPEPDTVAAESREEWTISVAVTDTGEADVVFTPQSGDIRIFVGGVEETENYTIVAPSRLKNRPGLTLGAGETDTLVYRVTETGPRGGTGMIQVRLRGYDRNRGPQTGQVVAVGTGTFFVETNAVVRVRRTEVLAHRLSPQGWGIVNTGQPFRVRVVIEERQGREGVDSVRVKLRSLSGGSTIQDSVRTIPYIGPADTGSVVFDVIAAGVENLSGEVFEASIVEATAHESQIPAAIEPPADPVNARAVVRIEKPAQLALTAAISGDDSLLTVSETFWLELLVRNLGTAQTDTGGRVTVVPPPGYFVAGPDSQFAEGPLTVRYDVGQTVRVKMRAPDTVSVADTIVAVLADVPRDLNTLQPCLVAKDTASLVVSTLQPFIRVARSEIAMPEGARDGILSTGQDFFVRVDVVSSSDLNQRRVALRVPTGRGYLVVQDTSRSVNADSATVYWYVKAPGSADLTEQRIVVFAEGIDGVGVRRTDFDTILVRTVPRATLSLQVSIVAPPGATDGTLTVGQPFLLQAKVTNTGQAAAVGQGKLRLDPGNTGVELDPEEEGLEKTFTMTGPVQTVTWRLRAPADPHEPDVVTVYFEERPNDENTGGPADITQPSRDLTVSTVAGGYVRLDSVFVASPVGAQDGVLSTSQTFVVTAVLSADGVTGQLDASILFSSPEYFTQSSLTKVTPGEGVAASWQVVAPSKAGARPDTIWVRVVGHDANNDTVLLSDISEPLVVDVQEQARLSLRPEIVEPEGAKDGVLSTGQRFVVRAVIENGGMAGLVPEDSFKVRIKVPTAGGYRLADGEPEVKSSTSPELSWQLIAPDQATLATYNVELILEDRPRDENSYEKATVVRDRDVVPVTTLERAKLRLTAAITDPPGARGGTVWTGQLFTITAQVENLGDAGWILLDSLRMVLEAPPGFTIVGDSVAAAWADRVQWRVKAPQQTGQNYVFTARLLQPPVDENSYQPAEIVQGTATLAVNVQAKMLIVDAGPAEKTNTVATGQAAIPLLRINVENRGQPGSDHILLQGWNVRFTDRNGKELRPTDVASRVWIALAQAPEVAVGSSEQIPDANPVYVALNQGLGDTLSGGEKRQYIVYVDLNPSSKVTDFRVQISGSEDVDAVDAESGTPVLIGDKTGNPVQQLNVSSDFSVVVQADLKKSFGCYPNPFGYGSRRTTTIVYYLKKATSVDISIYTLAGELVWNRHFTASDPQGQEGMHDGDVVWDGRNGDGMAVLNGVYVVRIVTGTGESAITKVAVVR